MSTEEDPAIKDGLRRMTTWNVIISSLILSHYAEAMLIFYENSEDRKTETHIPPNLPLGYLCSNQAACLTMTPRRCLPVSATVQDQRLGRSLVFDTIFSIFCSTVTEDIWKHTLVRFWKALCVLNLPHRWLCVECRVLFSQMDGARGEMAEMEPLLWVSELKVIPSTLFPARGSVSSWHTAFHVCLVYLGTSVLCFWFDVLPALSCVYSWGRGTGNTKIHQTKQLDGIRRTWK